MLAVVEGWVEKVAVFSRTTLDSTAYPEEGIMTRRKGKSISFDAMVKFFLHNYNIPTRKDIDRIAARLDRLESMIQSTAAPRRTRKAGSRKAGVKPSGVIGSATDQVFEVIQSMKQGAGVSDIQAVTGFDTKKIRNILYRLHKNDKIRRPERGLYKAVS